MLAEIKQGMESKAKLLHNRWEVARRHSPHRTLSDFVTPSSARRGTWMRSHPDRARREHRASVIGVSNGKSKRSPRARETSPEHLLPAPSSRQIVDMLDPQTNRCDILGLSG